MPYNSTAIPPTDAITGTTSLPLARIKRILSLDPEIQACSAAASFAITIATELFIRHLTSSASVIAKSEHRSGPASSSTTSGGVSKPRRNLQYRDFANAVSRIDNLEFLSDVIPRTTTYKEYKQQRAIRTAKSQVSRAASGSGAGGGGGEGGGVEGMKGQMTLDGRTGVPIRPAPPPQQAQAGAGLEEIADGEGRGDGEEGLREERKESLEAWRFANELRNNDVPIDVPAPEQPREGLASEHYTPNGEGTSMARVREEEDVDMG